MGRIERKRKKIVGGAGTGHRLVGAGKSGASRKFKRKGKDRADFGFARERDRSAARRVFRARERGDQKRQSRRGAACGRAGHAAGNGRAQGHVRYRHNASAVYISAADRKLIGSHERVRRVRAAVRDDKRKEQRRNGCFLERKELFRISRAVRAVFQTGYGARGGFFG